MAQHRVQGERTKNKTEKLLEKAKAREPKGIPERVSYQNLIIAYSCSTNVRKLWDRALLGLFIRYQFGYMSCF